MISDIATLNILLEIMFVRRMGLSGASNLFCMIGLMEHKLRSVLPMFCLTTTTRVMTFEMNSDINNKNTPVHRICRN